VAYLCQTEAMEREVLSQVSLLPHLEEKDRKSMPTVAQVRAEFDAWLNEEPAHLSMSPADLEAQELYRLLGVAKGR
jgi:hypothetical protein